MAFSFGYNYFVDVPDQVELLKGKVVFFKNSRYVAEFFFKRLEIGLAIPRATNTEEIKQAVAAVGAIIMPHNLYLHSALVKTRK